MFICLYMRAHSDRVIFSKAFHNARRLQSITILTISLPRLLTPFISSSIKHVLNCWQSFVVNH